MSTFKSTVTCTAIAVISLLFSFITDQPFYVKVDPSYSGINMVNTIPDSTGNYIYASNGNGIGIGDFNNDGLVDVFFSSNNSRNKLYLNKGEFKFEEVSKAANVEGNGLWGSGVSVIDINDDGMMDVYVSHSGPYSDPTQLANELFINKGNRNGIPYFEEEAKSFGLSLPGSNTSQATFFDFDKDGDLDVFILNHSIKNFVKIQPAANFRRSSDTTCSNQLLRNDGGKFVNITRNSGLIFSTANYGLGVIVSDLNNDGWEDIYATSDFEERDFCYLNQKDGTFSEVLEKSFGHTSFYSMGVDAGDINNDGRMDLVTLDMMPESNERQKIILANESLDKFLTLERNGFYHQSVRNMLQINTGIDSKGMMYYSERGQQAGISNTDWSWAPLFLDYDNDGRNDLFITSGYAKDYSNLDVLNNYNNQNSSGSKQYPDLKLPVRFYKNTGGNSFSELSNPLGFTEQKISGAAAYADFDNDGKMDLLYSNLNEAPSLYRNKGTVGNFLKISLKGPRGNRNAIGTRIEVTTKDVSQVKEVQPVRGYQSSQDPRINFGLSQATTASIKVRWPDGKVSILENVRVNQHLIIDHNMAIRELEKISSGSFLYTRKESSVLDRAAHKENNYVDFRHQYTIPYLVSTVGPAVAAADINKDGYMDFFQGGAKGQPGQILLGKGGNDFEQLIPECFLNDREYEDVAAIFLDADLDGDQDLVVGSGGIDHETGSNYYRDRFYRNNGNGSFSRIEDLFPQTTESSKGTIAGADFDRDGDIDLFIGGYTIPGSYGTTPRSFLYRNDSNKDTIRFTDVTDTYASSLKYTGMVTSAKWIDADGDGYDEIIIASEWTNCKLYKNQEGKKFQDISTKSGLTGMNGLWSSITATDLDGDGDIDILAGNAGLNMQLKANRNEPLRLYLSDLNATGKSNAIISYYIQGKEYPIYFRDEFLEAAFTYKQRYPTYQDYAKADMQHIFAKQPGSAIPINEVNELRSGAFIQQDGKFSFIPFGAEVQSSRINSIQFFDANNDGKKELLLSGNFYGYRKRFGRSDAMTPLILQQKSAQDFEILGADRTGLFLREETRNAIVINNGKQLIFFNNNAKPALYERN